MKWSIFLSCALLVLADGVTLAASTPAEKLLSSAAQPSRRSDPNSLLAHEQLVQKAKEGGIDVFFVGDSITRRWGASDSQYRPLLENWRSNFFGWNVARS